ncbi:hypothetical protein FS837_010812 [Tulasnella sp. UAMH 9824]|nr:hypothetical protein FS837_010812 [Tulasnella sp. UAMH 9824]
MITTGTIAAKGPNPSDSIGHTIAKHEEGGQEQADKAELDRYLTADRQIRPAIVEGMRSQSPQVRLESVTIVRRLTQLLGNAADVFAKVIIKSGVLLTIIDMLSSEDAELVSESAWVVANVSAAGFKSTSAVVKGGAFPKLLTVFQSSPNKTKLRALMALQNILAGSNDHRETLIREGGLEPALDVLEDPEQYSAGFIEIAASMIERGTISARDRSTCLRTTMRVMPVLLKFIRYHPNDSAETLSQAIKVLRTFTTSTVEAKVVVESGVIPRLVRLSQSVAENNDVQEDALRLLSRIIVGNTNRIQAALDNGLLDALQFCLGLRVQIRIRLACWVVGHIAHGTVPQATALVKSPIMPLIANIAIDGTVASEIRHDAAKALSYTAKNASSNPRASAFGAFTRNEVYRGRYRIPTFSGR